MSHYQVTTLLLSIIGVLIVPLVALMIRAMIKWVQTEGRLDVLCRDVATLVVNQERGNREIAEQMKYDRDATNVRLQYLERWNMENRGKNGLQ